MSKNFGGTLGEELVPRAVIVIGGVETIPLSYDLTMNSYLETDSAIITLPVELLDMSAILTKSRKENSYVEVEIWSGFLNAQTMQHSFTEANYNLKSNNEMKNDYVKRYKELLNLRWFGLLDKPQFNYGTNGDMVTLYCKELFTVLQDYTFEKKYEGESSLVKSIIKDISGSLKKLKITINKDVPESKLNVNMGMHTKFKKDTDEKEEVEKEYNTAGKSYFDVITEICKKAKLQFLQSDTDLYTYEFRDIKSSDKLYILDRAKDFLTAKIDTGSIGKSNSSKLAIIARSKNTTTNVITEGTFPEQLSDESPESMKIRIVNIGNNYTEEDCKRVAYDIANNYAKSSISGSLMLPNAITELKPNYLINLQDTTPLPALRKITRLTGGKTNKDGKLTNAINFVITSIHETFSSSGLSQPEVEFELDLNVNSFDTKTGEIKGITFFKGDAEDNDTSSGLSGIDMRLIDMNRIPNRLDFMRNSVKND